MVNITITTLPITEGASVKVGNNLKTVSGTTDSKGMVTLNWSTLYGTAYISVQKTDYVFALTPLLSKPSGISWGASSEWEKLTLPAIGTAVPVTVYALINPSSAIPSEITATLSQMRANLLSLIAKAKEYAAKALALAQSAINKIKNLDLSGAKTDIENAALALTSANVQLAAAKDIANQKGVSTTETSNAMTEAQNSISSAQSAINNALSQLSSKSTATLEDIATTVCNTWKTVVSSVYVPSQLSDTLSVAVGGAKWICSTDSSVYEQITGTGKITFAGYEIPFSITNGNGNIDVLEYVSLNKILSSLGLS